MNSSTIQLTDPELMDELAVTVATACLPTSKVHEMTEYLYGIRSACTPPPPTIKNLLDLPSVTNCLDAVAHVRRVSNYTQS